MELKKDLPKQEDTEKIIVEALKQLSGLKRMLEKVLKHS